MLHHHPSLQNTQSEAPHLTSPSNREMKGKDVNLGQLKDVKLTRMECSIIIMYNDLIILDEVGR
jgi:hypothetical protein